MDRREFLTSDRDVGWDLGLSRGMNDDDYDNMTQTERLEQMHQDNLPTESSETPTRYAMTAMERVSSSVFFEFVEMDWTNAYCPIGCCRPLYVFGATWLYWVRPALFYNIRTRSEAENDKILSAVQLDIV